MADFPKKTLADWEKLAAKELRDKPLPSLDWMTPEGILVKPLYTAADLDVEAPVLLSPMIFLPAPASPNERSRVRTLELVIDTGGRVQTARLLEQSTRLSDINVLQPAKLLKFRAAIKDGRPVMYRHRMRLTSAPY